MSENFTINNKKSMCSEKNSIQKMQGSLISHKYWLYKLITGLDYAYYD